MSWNPLLKESTIERGLAPVQLIARELEAATYTPRADVDWASERYAESALFYAYFARRFPGDCYKATVASLLEKAIDSLLTSQLSLGLYSGVCNLAWTVAHLQRVGMYVPGDDDQFGDVDAILSEELANPWPLGKYDLISGLVGIGVYLMEREHSPDAQSMLEHVIARLEETSEETPEGVRWLTPPEQLVEHQRKQAPNGYYNLGVAHGVPGIIGFLGRFCQRFPEHARARRLLDGAVVWLLSRKQSGAMGFFRGWESVGQSDAAGSRLAWCYGDLGVAVSLLLAARSVNKADWEQASLTIGEGCVGRLGKPDGVRDPGICHGSAGNMHLFNRLYQATGREEFARAALHYFEQTLTFWKPGEPVAGFQSRRAPKGQLLDPFLLEYLPDASFLVGAAGIGLALLAMTTDVVPEWDAVLLSNVRPLSTNVENTASPRE